MTGAQVPSGFPVFAFEHASHFWPHTVPQQILSCITQTVWLPQPFVGSHGVPRHAPQSGPPQSTPVSWPSWIPSVQLTHLLVARSQIGLFGSCAMQLAFDVHSTQFPALSQLPPLVPPSIRHAVPIGCAASPHLPATQTGVEQAPPPGHSSGFAHGGAAPVPVPVLVLAVVPPLPPLPPMRVARWRPMILSHPTMTTMQPASVAAAQ
jgi:hypothetical protein